MGWRSIILVGLLATQVGVAAFSRFDDRRYFCWAPHDQRTQYRIAVTIDGQPLSDEMIDGRYRVSAVGDEVRATAHLLGIIRQYEQTCGKDDQAQVTVTYHVNGGEEQVWHWPTP